MEYSMHQLSKLSGISTRALRYYDEIGLLKPSRVAETGYRFYEKEQVERLQQILFYRELDFSLEEIRRILSSLDFDRAAAFESHLAALMEKGKRLEAQIKNIKKSLSTLKGEMKMTDQEKFEGLKKKLIEENEQKYGEEIRSRYGHEAVKAARDKFMGLPEADYDESERIRLEFEQTLSAAFSSGDPAGELAQRACDLHRRWLMFFYPAYTREYHQGLGEMYLCDPRFRANYEKIAVGCTEFLRDAIRIYCQ